MQETMHVPCEAVDSSSTKAMVAIIGIVCAGGGNGLTNRRRISACGWLIGVGWIDANSAMMMCDEFVVGIV